MLIIVESPAKAKTISKIVGSKHTVKASVGHIRRISDDKKTSDGRTLEINGIDTENQFRPIFEVDENKKKVVTELKKLAKEAKDGILFATDEDREGEAISWHLAEVLKLDPKNIQRLVFHEITKTAIQNSLKNPRNLDLSMVSAQQARQVLDKLVGYKLSPVLWVTMNNYHLSAGRVQSPALRLVCEREKEILNFKPQEYWDILGKFATNENQQLKLHNLKYDKEKSEEEDEKETKAELEKQAGMLKFSFSKGKKLPKIIESLEVVTSLTAGLDQNLKFVVTEVQTKTEKTYPKPPFTTSTLQQAASSRLGYSPKTTMSLAQKLYEGVMVDNEPTALITYMRTDSTNLSGDSIKDVRTFLQKNFPEFLPDSAKFYKSKSRNAQEAHEAIRPTNALLSPDKLQGKLDGPMLKLYDLIWKQTISCQMTEEVRERFIFDLDNEQKDRFNGSISWTISSGYKAIWGQKEQKKADNLVKKGDVFYLQDLYNIQNFTKPPSRYSPASLVKKLEELGIGRPSTYASIISTLHDRNYVEEDTKSLRPTALGMKVNDLLTENFTLVTSSDLTAQMEEKLDQISRGEKAYETVLNDFWWDFKKEVESKSQQVTSEKTKYRQLETEKIPCPAGPGLMILKVGRFGEYWQSEEDPSIMFPKNFREYEQTLKEAKTKYDNQVKGLKCPKTGKDLIVRVSKKSLKIYVATETYKVGNDETVISLAKLDKEGWSQDTIEKHVQTAEKRAKSGKPIKAAKGKGRFRKKSS